MARSRTRRIVDALRRMIRRRRTPSPSEAEWLRLILVLRRLQHGQIASLQRLDGVRGLANAIGAFRGDFRALHGELIAAREAAEGLEKGLGERLQRLDGLPDPTAERRELDARLAKLDELSSRLGQALGDGRGLAAGGLEQALAQLSSVASRMESAVAAERAQGAGDELARLYERIQELAEAMARSPRARGGGDVDALAERLEARLSELEASLVSSGATGSGAANGGVLERLSERLAEQLELVRNATAAVPDTSGYADVLARMEALAMRIESAPAVLPDLPPDALADGRPVGVPVEEFEKLRATLAAAHEAHRRAETELEALRGQLRASELARVELETRHASELAEIADHAGRQLQRLEDDLKKKKRGLAELTQRNIQLQNLVGRLQAEATHPVPGPQRSEKSEPAHPDPPAPLPRGRPAPGRIHREAQGEG